MGSSAQTEDAFEREVPPLRAQYEERRLATNLFPPASLPCLELDVQRVGNRPFITFWFAAGTDHGQCVRIFDVPGTLSWDILRIRRGLPPRTSVGIVHRDMRADNLVFSPDGQRLVIIDLESRWGVRAAPEIAANGGLHDSGWSNQSDIYDIGNCIKSMVYANQPITFFVEWPVPAPLQAVVDACKCRSIPGRSTLAELQAAFHGG